jgi:hypothetical protein
MSEKIIKRSQKIILKFFRNLEGPQYGHTASMSLNVVRKVRSSDTVDGMTIFNKYFLIITLFNHRIVAPSPRVHILLAVLRLSFLENFRQILCNQFSLCNSYFMFYHPIFLFLSQMTSIYPFKPEGGTRFYNNKHNYSFMGISVWILL